STLLPGLNAVQFFDENRGVVAGDGTDAFPTGVFSTSDGGRSWKMLPGKRAESWQRIEFTDPQNGKVLGTNDDQDVKNGGFAPPPIGCRCHFSYMHRFTTTKRGCNMTLLDEQMLDSERGWAVGELGTILGTTDGGKTWKTLKCGAQRAAVLFIHDRPESISLGAIALLSKDGYICTTLSSPTLSRIWPSP